MTLRFHIQSNYCAVYHYTLQKLYALACSNPALDLCHAKHLPGVPMNDATQVFPMVWRFFPTLDPQVGVILFLAS